MGFLSRIKAFLPVLVIFCFFGIHNGASAADGSKYISIDEVRTDMEAYCLTVFSGTQVEKFPLKILSIVRNHRPGQDMILVIGTDERFNHASAIHGCSGSPVYIDGRLAGALAAGWDGSLDALYLVRPIDDMHAVGNSKTNGPTQSGGGADAPLSYDFTQPLDIKAYYEQSMAKLASRSANATDMLLPLSGSIDTNIDQRLAPALKGMGLMPVSGAALPGSSSELTGKFEPGGILSLVLCGGDISLAATGTVTEVDGDQVYGFGHSFNGEGSVNLPIAAGVVHSIVASRASSFKFASPGQVIGTLMHDQSCAVRGVIGQTPKTIPLNIDVDYYNDTQNRTYNCFLAKDRTLTPMILQVALTGAGQMQGALPFEHTVRYSGSIALNGSDPIRIDNVSSGQSLSQVVMDTYSAIGLIMNNPFEEPQIDSIDVKMTIEPKNMTASIWSVNVSENRVKPGQNVQATVSLKSYRAIEEQVTMDFAVPADLAPGRYKLQIMGSQEYSGFVSKMAPQKFRAFDMNTLRSGLKDLFANRRDKLYAVMAVPSTGIVFRQHELSNLPGTKMLLMQDEKRLEPREPYRAWAESTLNVNKIVEGSAQIDLIVEKQS